MPMDVVTFPPLDEGVSYMQVSAGNVHTLLLQSDGGAVACGRNGSNGTCNIPPLDEGVWYTQVSAGVSHSLLLLCDGSAVAFGDNHFRECNLPSLEPGTFYLSDTDMLSGRDRVLQLDLISDDAIAVTCSDLAGEEVVCLECRCVWSCLGIIIRPSHVNCMSAFRIFDWSCQTDSCWRQSAAQIQGSPLRMYLNGASELVTHSFRANQMRAPPALFAKKELVNFIYCTR